MKPNQLLHATASFGKVADKGTITLSGLSKNDFYVLGCSSGSSTTGLTGGKMYQSGVNSVSFPIKKGSEVIIALSINERDSKGGSQHNMILNATWPEGVEEPRIDLENIWNPTNPEKLGQIYWHSRPSSQYALSVRIDELTYTTADVNADDEEGRAKTFRSVPDGDLLCRYLIGEASAGDVTSVVAKREVELLVSERLAIALEKNSALHAEFKRATESFSKQTSELESQFDSLQENSKELTRKLRENNETFKLNTILLRKLKSAIAEEKVDNERRIFLRNTVANVLTRLDEIDLDDDDRESARETPEGWIKVNKKT